MNKLSLPTAIIVLAICILISAVMISGAIREALTDTYDWGELNSRLIEIIDALEDK